ncbi:hypothetical protein H6758_04725 [Candidatus Nomurabacteria bacterium]|nr:hypothetical protein [Candidatus Nomurabacteria bacterium]
MRSETEAVEIQDPPLEELKKGKSCLTYSCLSGCGCIIIPLICSLFLLNLILHSGEKRIEQLPEWFPAGLELYDSDQVEKMTLRKERLHEFLPFDLFSKNSSSKRALNLTWHNMLAKPDFILEHYIRMCERANLSVYSRTKQENTETVYFQSRDARYKGYIQVIDDPDTTHTDTVLLEMHFDPHYGHKNN